MIIAVQPDSFGEDDSSSPIWIRTLRAAGHQVRVVDVYSSDILGQLDGCQGFMWRYSHDPRSKQVAKRLLPVLENTLRLQVYPDQNSCWHFDDKIAQFYLMKALGIPMPETWVWFDKEAALGFVGSAQYPLVLKLSGGAGSSNVRLLQDASEARSWVDRLFDYGVESLSGTSPSLPTRAVKAVKLILTGRYRSYLGLQKKYAYFQEFLPNNDFDTRITVIGDRAFGFRRFNRKDDFRASGSGHIDHDPRAIDERFIETAFKAAAKLQAQSCAVDGLWKGGAPVLCEVSYAYASWAVHDCPGHWDRDLNWHQGSMWPEEAQAQDFIERLEAKA